MYQVVFCGTPEHSCPSLRALHEDDAFNVSLVITQPDKPVGRKKEITPPPVKKLAEKLGIPVQQPEDINNALSDRPDFLVVVAYGQILKENVLRLPKIAAVNLHFSLLPKRSEEHTV